MSRTEDRDAVFDWPRCARSLLTVRAAISSARFVEAPRDFVDSLMCSYFRSCLPVHSLLGTRTHLLEDFSVLGSFLPGRRRRKRRRNQPPRAFRMFRAMTTRWIWFVPS